VVVVVVVGVVVSKIAVKRSRWMRRMRSRPPGVLRAASWGFRGGHCGSGGAGGGGMAELGSGCSGRRGRERKVNVERMNNESHSPVCVVVG
jgi:hypothetical protein